MAKIGVQIKRARHERGLSMEQVSALARDRGMPLSGAALSRIEAGIHDPSHDTMKTLAKVLGGRFVVTGQGATFEPVNNNGEAA